MRSLPEAAARSGMRDRRVSGEWAWHHRRVTSLDLLLRGGTVVDGGGGPGVRADVGVLGDRILAVGDLSDVDVTSVATVVDCTGRIVAPGFIDPHGHSDGSLVRGRRPRQPSPPGLHDPAVRQLRRHPGPDRRSRPRAHRAGAAPARACRAVGTFAEYLDRVEEGALGPNVAFLVGHGTVRGSVMGAEARPADRR